MELALAMKLLAAALFGGAVVLFALAAWSLIQRHRGGMVKPAGNDFPGAFRARPAGCADRPG